MNSVIVIISIIGLFILFWFVWGLLSRFYVIPCPSWLGWLVEMDNPFTKTNRAATIIENADLKEGMTVLDVGCGPGRVTIPLAVKVGITGKVVAMDIQSEMLNKVRMKAQELNLNNIEYVHAALSDHTLLRNQFDRVFLVTVLGEIPKQSEALKEIFNTLKPGGLLLITEIIFDPHYQRSKRIIDIATLEGFQVKNRLGSHIAYILKLEKPMGNKKIPIASNEK